MGVDVPSGYNTTAGTAVWNKGGKKLVSIIYIHVHVPVNLLVLVFNVKIFVVSDLSVHLKGREGEGA